MAEIKVQLRQLIDDRNSPSRIVGDLDVTSSEDFPLSLTLQHFDIRDINSRSGAFSKTFDIPATNNNNRILRHLHKSGFDNEHSNVLSRIDAVIYADNLPIIAGKIRITKVTKSEQPISYSCEFVGDNMDWASGIKNKELKDLDILFRKIENFFIKKKFNYPKTIIDFVNGELKMIREGSVSKENIEKLL